MLCDYHLHSSFSDDSDTPMEDMVRRALALGLDELCFTEHVDYGVKDDRNCPYEAYFRELSRMRRLYGARITIRAGIEFGLQVETAAQYERDFARFGFDFVILSVHEIGNRELWTNEYQEGKSQEEYQTGYYQAILDCMQVFRNYSVLGHLDMIKRYDRLGAYPDEKALPLVERILRQAIADGKGIEVNTSSFRYGLPDLTPSRRILSLYRELGGRILTIGSDSHETVHLADHIPAVRETLRSLGFREFCTFERMQPSFHPL